MVNEGYLEPKGGRFCHRLRLGPDKPGGLSNGQAGGHQLFVAHDAEDAGADLCRVHRDVIVNHGNELDRTIHRVSNAAAFRSAHPESNQRATDHEHAFKYSGHRNLLAWLIPIDRNFRHLLQGQINPIVSG